MKRAPFRRFEDGSYYIHTGPLSRVRYGKRLKRAMKALARVRG